MYKCLANSGPLLKSTEDNNGWVYVGKEVYGTRQIKSIAPQDPNLYYDALGRLYPKPPTNNYRYFSGKSVVKTVVTEEPLEFDVWLKTITDFEGNDAQLYLKRDEDADLIKDSTVYQDGSWSIFKSNFTTMEMQLQTSDGIDAFGKYDDQGNELESYLIYQGGTLIYEKHEPSHFANYVKKYSASFKVKYEHTNRLCSGLNEYGDMPKARCRKYQKTQLSSHNNLKNCYVNKKYCPGVGSDATFGYSESGLLGAFECECNSEDGRYYHTYNEDELITAIYIEVMESNWQYDHTQEDWQEYCWTKNDMQLTYEHEVVHIRNGIEYAKQMYERFMDWSGRKNGRDYTTMSECVSEGEIKIGYIKQRWDFWALAVEFAHLGRTPDHPNSPTPTSRNRKEILCAE